MVVQIAAEFVKQPVKRQQHAHSGGRCSNTTLPVRQAARSTSLRSRE